MKPTVCLSMIVKNEAHVIERCLRSLLPFIDTWVISDTGSTDCTQIILQQALASLPGTLIERPWVNFAHNRNEALALARTKADYTLIIDADDSLQYATDFKLPELTADAYTFEILHGTVRYRRPHLLKNTLPWRWVGVLHEYLSADGINGISHLDGLAIRYNGDGARSKDREKYIRDAKVLEDALKEETDEGLRTRYLFYLAQSYRDGGRREDALRYYLMRAERPGWPEETYVSLLVAGRLQAELNYPIDDILATFAKATALVPTRIEARQGAALALRNAKRFQEGYEMAAAGLQIEPPAGGLFVDHSIYEYGLRDEYAVNAYWAGHHEESLDACLTLLESDKTPAAQHKRYIANARFAFEQLRKRPKVTAASGSSADSHALVTAPKNLIPNVSWYAVDQNALAAYASGAYDEAFEAWMSLLDHPNTPTSEKPRLEMNRDFAVAHIKDQYLEYPTNLIQQLSKRSPAADPTVTLTITSCRRLDLFKATVCSFLNACIDIDTVDRFICIDDNSSADDRAQMQALFPFFEFVWKSEADRGHARSLNVLQNMVTTPWIIHLEDDWHFFARRRYISQSLEIMNSDLAFGQVLFNRNYAEILTDRHIAGGIQEFLPDSLTPFVRHQYYPADSDSYRVFNATHPDRGNNVYWPHYSLRPGVVRRAALDTVGSYSESPGHFEMDYAYRYTDIGYKTAFLNGIYALHTGRLTAERFDNTRANAYQLNNVAYPADAIT